jgi:hypothetical protein
MNKNQQKNRMGAVIILLAAACLNGYAQQDSTKVSSDSKEEGNRNVMLNAASANGPREISIGLPGGDVNVLENGLPVVYNSNPHNVNTHWRGDSSLGHTGLLKISETAITTGNIGYAVNSFTELGLDKGSGRGGKQVKGYLFSLPASPCISRAGRVRFFLFSFRCSIGVVRCRLLFSATLSRHNIPCK